MALRNDIDDIVKNIKEGQYPNEASVAQGIVLRLLNALGWPIFDTKTVIREYTLEGKRVDLALCHPSLKPIVFIEIKQLGLAEGADKQLFEYAFHKGVPIAVLTDGRTWNFFLPQERGDYRERQVYKLDLIERDNKECADHFERYLHYTSIQNGKALDAIKYDYQDVTQKRQIQEILPQAWNKLIDDKDELLIDVVADKVESLCGYKPNNEQVLGFLKTFRTDTLKGSNIKIEKPILEPDDGEIGNKGPKGNEQVKDYLIPVIKQMWQGRSHTEAFKSVAIKLNVFPQTVWSQCTRTLNLDLGEFIDMVKSKKIIQYIKHKYPDKVELINRELG